MGGSFGSFFMISQVLQLKLQRAANNCRKPHHSDQAQPNYCKLLSKPLGGIPVALVSTKPLGEIPVALASDEKSLCLSATRFEMTAPSGRDEHGRTDGRSSWTEVRRRTATVDNMGCQPRTTNTNHRPANFWQRLCLANTAHSLLSGECAFALGLQEVQVHTTPSYLNLLFVCSFAVMMVGWQCVAAAAG